MTNLEAEQGLSIYQQRMKIEQTFRDLKSLMNKRRSLIEKMVALVLIAYAIALIVGETLRTLIFLEGDRKNKLYSGVFIFLKFKPNLSPPLISQARMVFSRLILPVRTNV